MSGAAAKSTVRNTLGAVSIRKFSVKGNMVATARVPGSKI
jgi:hypothetical protein